MALLDAADRGQDPRAKCAISADAAGSAQCLQRRAHAQPRPALDRGARSESGVCGARARSHGRSRRRRARHAGRAAELEPGLRAEALRELGTQGAAGQKPLWAAFDRALSAVPDDATLTGENYGPLAALVDALSPPILGSGAQLQALAELAIADTDSLTLKRRKVHLRCAAAALLAGSNYQSARLLACDPAKDSLTRELFVLRVLTREKLRGARKKAYLRSAHADDAALREAALERLAEHPELPEAYAVLADALGAKALGVVASAAHLLSSYPERAARTVDDSDDLHAAPKPDPSVIQALTAAYAAATQRHSVEVQSLLLDAIGALQILSLKDDANVACSSDNPTLREHAQKALRLLGEQARRCDEFEPSTLSAASTAESGRSLLTFDTDAGPLTIRTRLELCADGRRARRRLGPARVLRRYPGAPRGAGFRRPIRRPGRRRLRWGRTTAPALRDLAHPVSDVARWAWRCPAATPARASYS